MTGKEALKLAQDTILANNGNNKSSFTMKNLYLVEKELDEKDKKLAKYKRAFEILKEKLDIDVSCDDFFPDDVSYILWTGIEPATISKEEYELLEELMNNESR